MSPFVLPSARVRRSGAREGGEPAHGKSQPVRWISDGSNVPCEPHGEWLRSGKMPPGGVRQPEWLRIVFQPFIQRHPTYRRADLLIAVPPSNTNKDFDLPAVLVAEVARRSGLQDATAAVRKTRATGPMKECRTVQEKVDNLKDAFAADAAAVQGKNILLVDDIYQSGFSINEIGRVLRGAGASRVVGLTATKTAQDLSEDLTDEFP